MPRPNPYDFDPALVGQASELVGQPIAMAETRQPVAQEVTLQAPPAVVAPAPQPVVVQQPQPVEVVSPHLSQALQVAGQAPIEPAVKAPTPPRVQPAPEPAPAYLNRNQKSGAILADADAARNRMLDNTTAQGENASNMHAQMADVYGQDAAGQKERLAGTDARVDAAREESLAYAKRARDHVQEMENSLKDGPPKHTLATVMGIVAAITGGGGGAAGIASAIGQHIGGAGADEWRTKIQGHSELAKSFEALSHDRDAHAESDIHQQNGLVAAQTAMYASALKQISETAQSEGVRLDAAEARDKLLAGFADAAYQQKAAMEAAQSKAGAAGKRSQKEDEIYRALTQIQDPQSRAMVAGQFGKLGQTVLQDIQKSDKNVADLGKTAADTEQSVAAARKAAEEAKAGPKLTEGEAKSAAIVSGFKPAFHRLEALVKSGEGANRGATKETWLPDFLRGEATLQQRADIKNLAMGVLRAESGSNIPDNEIQLKYEALPVNSGDPEIRAQGLHDLVTAARALDRQGVLSKPDDNAHTPTQPVVNPAKDPRFKPLSRATVPSAASRGITSGPNGIALPQTRVNVTPEQVAGVPQQWVKR